MLNSLMLWLTQRLPDVCKPKMRVEWSPPDWPIIGDIELERTVTQTQIDRFEKQLDTLTKSPPDFPPLILKAQQDAINSQLEDLREQHCIENGKIIHEWFTTTLDEFLHKNCNEILTSWARDIVEAFYEPINVVPWQKMKIVYLKSYPSLNMCVKIIAEDNQTSMITQFKTDVDVQTIEDELGQLSLEDLESVARGNIFGRNYFIAVNTEKFLDKLRQEITGKYYKDEVEDSV